MNDAKFVFSLDGTIVMNDADFFSNLFVTNSNKPFIISIKYKWNNLAKMGPKTFINLKAWKLLLG